MGCLGKPLVPSVAPLYQDSVILSSALGLDATKQSPEQEAACQEERHRGNPCHDDCQSVAWHITVGSRPARVTVAFVSVVTCAVTTAIILTSDQDILKGHTLVTMTHSGLTTLCSRGRKARILQVKAKVNKSSPVRKHIDLKNKPLPDMTPPNQCFLAPTGAQGVKMSVRMYVWPTNLQVSIFSVSWGTRLVDTRARFFKPTSSLSLVLFPT